MTRLEQILFAFVVLMTLVAALVLIEHAVTR